MIVTPKMDFVEGSFDTKDAVMVCVPRWKYRTVELCIKAGNWNVPMGGSNYMMTIDLCLQTRHLRMQRYLEKRSREGGMNVIVRSNG